MSDPVRPDGHVAAIQANFTNGSKRHKVVVDISAVAWEYTDNEMWRIALFRQAI